MSSDGSTHLVSVPALPETSLGSGGSITGISMFGAAEVILVSSGREASEEDDEGGEEEEDHGRNQRPHSHGVFSFAAALVLAMIVDVVSDDAEEGQVSGHDHHGEDPGEGCGQRRKQCAADTGTKSEDEGNECHAGDDGVENHHTRQRLGGILRGIAEGGLIDGGHDASWVIANVLPGTEVLLGSGVAHAVAERTKGDGRSVGERHLHDGDIIYDGRADGGDEEENSGSEEEEGPDMMKEPGVGHLEERWGRFAWLGMEGIE